MNRISGALLLIQLIFLIHSCKKDEPLAHNYGVVTDIDGNVYKTINIGVQTWLAENLRTKRYYNGDLIATTTPSTLDINAEITPKYQWAYSGNEDNVTTYGRLYTWYAVTDSRNVCPSGWHVPSDAEWDILTSYLGGSDISGTKMKSINGWRNNGNGTNESGFTALPGGARAGSEANPFAAIGNGGHWWSTSEDNTGAAWARILSYTSSSIGKLGHSKQNGLSVRCIKDN